MPNGKELPEPEGRLLDCQIEALRLTLERLYWQLSKRDALEGQALRVALGKVQSGSPGCRLEFRSGNAGQELFVQWRSPSPKAEPTPD